MITKNLLILGAGQYSFIAKETAEAMGVFGEIKVLDIKDQDPAERSAKLTEYLQNFPLAFVAIGISEVRLELLLELREIGFELVNLIHPSAVVMPSALLECGCIAEALSVVNSNTQIKKGTIISAGAVVNHNCLVEEGCHIDCNATVPARSIVPKGTKVLCGSVFN